MGIRSNLTMGAALPPRTSGRGLCAENLMKKTKTEQEHPQKSEDLKQLGEEVSLARFTNVLVGNAQDEVAATGVTVLIFPEGAWVGADISGGGPASRESALLSPLAAPTPVNAIVLSGGSAFGLAASDGVMTWLEERSIGFDTGVAKVPIVVQSCLYDLAYGSAQKRPDAAMGRAACDAALSHKAVNCGSYGAGTGATVGKILGMARAMKSGLGIYALAFGDLLMAAIVAVNALGDIYEPETGQKLAGLLTEDRSAFADTSAALCRLDLPDNLFASTNTTIGAVLTNAAFDKAQLGKLASMTRNAYARCIRPVGTLADGDTIYAVSTGPLKADLNLAGVLASHAMTRAIKRAVTASQMPHETFLAHC